MSIDLEDFIFDTSSLPYCRFNPVCPRKSDSISPHFFSFDFARSEDSPAASIPTEIIKNLGISEGDKFEIVQKDGGIFLCPVVVYPKEKMLALAKLLKEVEQDTANQKEFASVDDMFADIGLDINV